MKKQQIIVIGAGIVGASIAFNLTERGAQVTVIDAAEPGQGASAVSFAWINSRDKNPRHYHDLNRRSLDMWDRFARRLGGDVGLTWGGELRWASTSAGAAELTARVKQLQSWGYPIHLVDAETLKAMEPTLAGGTVTAACFSSGDGQVDTGRVIGACLAHVSERGGLIRSRSGLKALHVGPTSKVETVEIDNRELTCDAVVLTGGPDTPALSAMAGIEVPLHHTFGATIITEPLPPLFQSTAVMHTPVDISPQIAFRQLPDGAVMIHAGSHNGSLGRTDEEVEEAVKAATSWLPALEGIEIREVRRGRRPIPRDGHPILGFTKAVPNLYLAAMHSGVTLSALVGEMATTEILDGARIELLEPYRVERFN